MTSTRPVPPAGTKTFFGQPRGLATLFMTEMWERFSFYGMRALLVLYLVAPTDNGFPPGPGLGFSDGDASAIYGSYNALVYVLPLAGGWVADKLWGARRSVLVGAIVIASGHFSMALPFRATFWLGLVLIAVGTGLLKPNISAIVGHLYAPDDERRDAGFSLFYMGINLGAFAAPLVTSALEINYGWHVGFAAAGVGMVFGIIQYVLGAKHLGTAGIKPSDPASPAVRRRVLRLSALGLLVVIGVVAGDAAFFGFDVTDLTTMLTVVILILPGIYFWRLYRAPLTPTERSKVSAFVLIFLAAAVFWMIYDQAGSTLNLFAENNTERTLGSFIVPAAWFQSVNPVMIIIFAPLFAALWSKLANRAPGLPTKFAIGMVGIALSFLIMIPAALRADSGLVSPVWLLSVYLVQTWAELLISPTGLSATTTLAPRGYGSQMLALWFLATAVGDSVGGQLIKVLENASTTVFFGVFAGAALVAAALIAALIPRLRRLLAAGHD